MIFVLCIIVSILALFYNNYQIKRNEAVFNIRKIWIADKNKKWHKYTYEKMLNPSIKNWLGLKIPKEKDFQ